MAELGPRSRARGSEDEQGESYFVSMSDLMAGVLFLFIIMLTDYALLLRAAPPPPAPRREHASAAVEGLRMPASAPASGPADAGITPAAMPDARTAALYAIADQLKARNVTVSVDTAGGALRFANDALFTGGGSDLTPQGRLTLNALAVALDSVLPCFTVDPAQRAAACPRATGRIGAVIVEGHTDAGAATDWSQSVGQGSSAFQALLQARPNLPALQSGGGQSLISVAGYGPSRPVQPGAGPDQRRANSRLDLRLVLAS